MSVSQAKEFKTQTIKSHFKKWNQKREKRKGKVTNVRIFQTSKTPVTTQSYADVTSPAALIPSEKQRQVLKGNKCGRGQKRGQGQKRGGY